MKLLVAIVVSVFLVAVAAICVFGFMATFEPTDNTSQFMAFRIGYVGVGMACITGIGLLIAKFLRT